MITPLILGWGLAQLNLKRLTCNHRTSQTMDVIFYLQPKMYFQLFETREERHRRRVPSLWRHRSKQRCVSLRRQQTCTICTNVPLPTPETTDNRHGAVSKHETHQTGTFLLVQFGNVAKKTCNLCK